MNTSPLLDAVHRTAPERVALDDGLRQVTFGQLGALLEDEGAWLAGHGERFALLADNGTGWAVADLALHLRRLPSVPLPGYFTPQQVQHALDDAGIDCLLTDDPRRMRDMLSGWRSNGVSAPAW